MIEYFLHLGILICIYSILAISLNVVIGFTGLLNIGHVAFYAIGAYTSALLVIAGVPWIFALVAAVLVSAFFGLLLGYPALKLKGDYLAIATLGFGEIIRLLLKNWNSLTHGPMGIPGIPKPSMFGIVFSSSLAYFLLFLVLLSASYFIVRRLMKSPFGRVLISIREDESASQALGKDVVRYKVMALVIGAGFAGLAGSLFAHYISFIDPGSFTILETILMLCMIVLGGLGSVSGSVLGAVILVLLPEPLRFLGLPSGIAAAMRQVLYALLLLLIMIYKPEGILGNKMKARIKGLWQ